MTRYYHYFHWTMPAALGSFEEVWSFLEGHLGHWGKMYHILRVGFADGFEEEWSL